MVGCCEHGTARNLSVKFREFLDYLRNCYLLRIGLFYAFSFYKTKDSRREETNSYMDLCNKVFLIQKSM